MMRESLLILFASIVLFGSCTSPSTTPEPTSKPTLDASPTPSAEQYLLPTNGPGWTRIGVPAGGDSLQAQWIEVYAPDGYKLNAAVFYPAGQGPFPIVIVLHGSAGFVMRTVALGEVFAKAGFLTVAGAWFSGSGEKSPTSPTPIVSPYGPPFSGANLDSINYVKALVNTAETLPGADSRNVGLFGVSRGANAALLVASTDGVQAVVADSASGKPPSKVAAIVIDTSPTDMVETLTAPVLILHGTADQIVPVEAIQVYERALVQWGKPYEAHYYEGAPHAVTQYPGTRADAQKRAVDFFTKYFAPAGSHSTVNP